MRNYRKEYDDYHKKPEQKKNRASRNGARRRMRKILGKKAIEGKDIDHNDGNPKNNSRSNLRVLNKSANRSKKWKH